MEIWDAYDSAFNKIEGKSLIRGEAIPDNMFHLVCDILVRHTDGSYLLMRRDARKPYGGMWEASAGGSALAGETPLQCAVRELREETGIVSDRIVQVGIVRGISSFYAEFICTTDCDKHSVALQEGETTDYRWVSKEELLAMTPEELITHRIQRFVPELKSSSI